MKLLLERIDEVRLGRSNGGRLDPDRLRMVRGIRAAVRNRLLLANLAGAIVVLVIVQMALQETIAPQLGVWLTALGFGALFVCFAALANLWAYLAFTRSVAWVVERRRPSRAERADVLRMPWQSALRPLVFWLAAACAYGFVAPTIGGAEVHTAVKVAYGIVLGGAVSCGVGFLLIERSFTALFAIALEGRLPRRPATLGVRMRLILAWVVGSAVPLFAIGVAALSPDDVPGGALAVLALGGLGAGLLATGASAKSLADPLDDVRDALGRVRDGDLDSDLVVDDGGEIGEVQAGFNQMVKGLRDRERVRDLFGRHVSQPVAGHALERGTGLGGEQHHVSVIFVDIVGSTALAESLPPDEVVKMLNEFFEVVVGTVDDQGGWVNKFEGDGALCVFGAPASSDDHAERALRAARSLHRELESLRSRYPDLEAGIGISSGPVVAGNVGTEARFEYTVIGTTVNEAARLTELSKDREVKVLATRLAVGQANSEVAHWQSAGSVSLRGKQARTDVCRPIL